MLFPKLLLRQTSVNEDSLAYLWTMLHAARIIYIMVEQHPGLECCILYVVCT